MQQTEKYKLNKPESTDTFSVSPLNENADKLEAQLARLDGADAAETAARTAETAALDQRVTLLEAKKVVAGSYMGGTGTQTIDLGFYPAGVIVCGYGLTRIAVREFWGVALEVKENGFSVRNNGAGEQFNMSGNKYHYVAFG